MRTTRLVAAVVTAAVLLAAACGSDDDQAGDSTGRAAGGTTTTTNEATTTTSTTEPSASTTTSAPYNPTGLAAGPEYVTTEGPSGAGCTPGDRTTLPDGWWPGEITSVRESAVDFDLVCFFSGDAATAAAAEDGAEATDDYYVRNNNARTFRVEFPAGTPATCVRTDAEPFACQVDDVLTLYRTTDTTGTTVLDGTPMAPYPLVWVHVSGGSGDYIYMQYTP